MSRNAKLIIYGVILLFSIVLKIKNNNEESKSSSDSQDTVVNKTTPKPIQSNKPNKIINNYKPLTKLDVTFYPTPENGHSPYDDYFGKAYTTTQLETNSLLKILILQMQSYCL